MSEEGAPIATIPFRAPQLIATPGIDSFIPKPGIIGYNAAWKEADFLTYTPGTASKLPNPTGGFATTPGPVLGTTMTVVAHASAGAPGGAYYIVATYTKSGAESQGTEILFSVPAGFVPEVTVLSAGAPATADHFAVYASLFSGGEALQQATKTTTTLGTAFDIPNALINQYGFQRSATGDSALLAIAQHDSAEVYVKGLGGGNTAGGPAQILGIYANPPPLDGPFSTQALVYGLQNGQLVEMSLLQAYSPGLIGAAVGLNLDSGSNQFIADTGQTQIGTIQAFMGGAPSDVGGPFVVGTRVAVQILPSVAF